MTADWRIHCDVPASFGRVSLVHQMVAELKGMGATFVRVTCPDFPVVIVEGWREEPVDQGPEPTIEEVVGFGT